MNGYCLASQPSSGTRTVLFITKTEVLNFSYESVVLKPIILRTKFWCAHHCLATSTIISSIVRSQIIIMSQRGVTGGPKVKRVMTQAINLIFEFLKNVSMVSLLIFCHLRNNFVKNTLVSKTEREDSDLVIWECVDQDGGYYYCKYPLPYPCPLPSSV